MEAMGVSTDDVWTAAFEKCGICYVDLTFL
jgi:hypothetical protein